MFEAEARRQLNLIPRIEKIHVEYVGQPENATLILNKVSPQLFWRLVVKTVLRIRDVYPGSDFFPSRIPDSNFSIPDPGSTFKNLSVLTQKIVF